MTHAAAVQREIRPLNVLIVEDSEEDADLIVLELKRGGYDPEFRRVDTAEAMSRALNDKPWDLVLSDFSMPRFSVSEALALVKQKEDDVPFVIVSATIGEEAAVEAMKAGAHDYILKHRLGRLVPAIQRELRESAMRRERRVLEEQLRRAQKLESLGLLAGGIAHDFNNLLTGIMGNASLVMETASLAPGPFGMLQDIIRASERAADLTRQLLAYAGKGKFVIEQVDASAVVRDISELIRVSVPRTVDLSVDLHPDLPRLEGDPSQIQQLVMNLVLNAVEATGERPGRVRVTTCIRDIGRSDAVTHFRPGAPAPGRYIEIRVSDNGCGMNESVKAQIFDPFFTTKFTGRGLGLSAALGIVYGHKGAIAVETAEGTGSTFSVLMPAVAATDGPKDSAPVSNAVETGAGVVLIVDDEDLVRRAARAALEHFGYTVLEAADGSDGADLFSRMHDRISAVLLDLTMPRMDGHDVWRYIRRICPDMKVVIASGFEEFDAMQQFTDDPALSFIKKPFTAAALARKIGAALGRKGKAQ